MKLKFLVIGDINIDLILPVYNLPKKGLQTITDKYWLQLGGSSAIFSLAASRLGCDTTFVGLLGKDYFSNFLIKEMKNFGIKCKIIRKEKEFAGITCSLILKNGERTMITYRGSNSNLSLKDIGLTCIKSDFCIKSDLLHIGGFNLLDNLRKDVIKIFENVKKKKVLTSLDPNWDPKGWTKERLKQLLEILRTTDFFFPDYEEGKAITKFEEPKKIVMKLLRCCNGIVALKLGKNGCLVGKDSKLFIAKGFKVNALQTTGAGDVFDAAFLSYYLKTFDIKNSAVFANAAGSIYITKVKKRFPTFNEINRFLYERKN